MMNLALWLKKYDFRADQVQAFYPSPMATATAMYHSGKNPLRKVTYKTDSVETVKDPAQRKLHKAFLRYHDPANWKLLYDALVRMGRRDLIGDSPKCLIPATQPEREYNAPRRKNSGNAHSKRTGKNTAKQQHKPAQARQKTTKTGQKKTQNNSGQPKKGTLLTQHTGLPPRKQTTSSNAKRSKPKRRR